MFNRLLEEDLKKWKSSPIRKPLILRGARQVGKTYVVRKFGAENFNQVIEINFEKKDQFLFFDGAKSVDDFLNRINLFFSQKITPGKSLLFLDEIQESTNSLELLRFFAEEKPELHVITAGSLLEAKINNGWSAPVGRVDYKYLYPLTFFEYLEAKGKLPLLETLKNYNLADAFEYDNLVSDLYKEYVIVGGMPAVVDSFINHNSYEEMQTIFSGLNTAYIDDIRKYAKSVEESRYLEHVIEAGPKVAGTLFNYENFGGSSFRSREMGNAIQMIEKIGLLRQVMAVNSTELPVFPKSNRAKKLIWLDVGLINFANKAYQELITGEYKGKVMEQVVGQSLMAHGINEVQTLYYWSKEKNEGSAEVDFCFQYNSQLVGLEVKSGNVGQMKSLFSMGNSNKDVILARVSWDNLGVEKWDYAGNKYEVLSLPFYLLDRWEDLVKQFIG
jgi:predicted AAA+ superfamily ATPase